MGYKLNALVNDWPSGGVFTTQGLTARGYSASDLQNYKASNWITSLGDGAYSRSGDTPTIFGAVRALNEQLQLPLHLGGRVALKLQGITHHLSFGSELFDLFHPKGVKVPKWFTNHPWPVTIRTHTQSLFGDNYRLGVQTVVFEGHPCLVASKERALLEFINMTTTPERFLEAVEFVGSATILNHTLLQKLLVACTSVKTKRVFLYAAEKQKWDWLKKLDLKKISLGSGPRTVIPDGVYDSKYKITVPREWLKDALV